MAGVEERDEFASGSVPGIPTETKAFQMKVVEPHVNAYYGATKEIQTQATGPVHGLPCLMWRWWAFTAPMGRERWVGIGTASFMKLMHVPSQTKRSHHRLKLSPHTSIMKNRVEFPMGLTIESK